MNILPFFLRMPSVQFGLILRLVLVGFAAALSVQPASAGDQAGTFEITAGITRLSPDLSSTELGITDPVVKPFPGTGYTISGFTTLGLALRYWATDSSTIEFWGGIPRISTFTGTGTLTAPAINPLGTTRALAPIFLYRYHFNEPSAVWRPSIAAGMNYTTYTKSKLTPQFQAFLSNTLTQGGSSAIPSSVDFNPSWNPVVGIGLDYQLTTDWKITSSLMYMPLKLRATIKTAVNSTVFTSNGELTVNPTFWFVGVSHKF